MRFIILLCSIILIYVLITKSDNFTVSSTNNYHKYIIDSCTQDELDNLVNFILNKLNKDIGFSYKLIEYEKISKKVYPNLDKHYKILAIIYEKNKFISKKVIIDFIHVKKCNKLKLLSIKLVGSYEYIMKRPKTESNIISICNLNQKSIGDNNTSLEYSFLSNKDKLEYTNRCDLNKWILPKNMECIYRELSNPFPCRKQQKWWNKDSIHNTNCSTSKCRGINTSTNDRVKIPSLNPTVVGKANENEQFNWLFSNVEGV